MQSAAVVERHTPPRTMLPASLSVFAPNCINATTNPNLNLQPLNHSPKIPVRIAKLQLIEAWCHRRRSLNVVAVWPNIHASIHCLPLSQSLRGGQTTGNGS